MSTTTFIAVQPFEAKAAPSTSTSAPEACVSERAQKPTHAWGGWWR